VSWKSTGNFLGWTCRHLDYSLPLGCHKIY